MVITIYLWLSIIVNYLVIHGYNYISMVIYYGYLWLSMVTVTYGYLNLLKNNTVPQSSRTQTEQFELWHCGTGKGNSVQNG